MSFIEVTSRVESMAESEQVLIAAVSSFFTI